MDLGFWECCWIEKRLIYVVEHQKCFSFLDENKGVRRNVCFFDGLDLGLWGDAAPPGGLSSSCRSRRTSGGPWSPRAGSPGGVVPATESFSSWCLSCVGHIKAAPEPHQFGAKVILLEIQQEGSQACPDAAAGQTWLKRRGDKNHGDLVRLEGALVQILHQGLHPGQVGVHADVTRFMSDQAARSTTEPSERAWNQRAQVLVPGT